MSNHILIFPDEKSGGREQAYYVAIWDEQLQDIGDVTEWCHNYEAAQKTAEVWARNLGLEIREDDE